MSWYPVGKVEIEVTPEMIEAGLNAVSKKLSMVDVICIYIDMQRVKMQQTPGSGAAP